MATPSQRTNTWTLNEWYDQAVAGTQGDYVGAYKLFAWGRGNYGTLGLNNNTSRSSPTQVGTNSNWVSISDGKETLHTLGSKTNGTLWSWGYANQGELGQNDKTDRSSPIQIPGTTWSSNISTGENHSMATKTDGTLWGFGKNPDGAIGVGQPGNVKYSSPIQVPGTTWKYVACDNKSTLAVKTDGTLWSWGDNGNGQLGHTAPGENYSPKPVGTDTTWSAVIGSWYSSMAVKTDGTLWVWGANDYAQLGLSNGTNYSSPMQLPGTYSTRGTGYTASGGRYHNAILNSAGELFTFGNNDKGWLGHNNRTNYSSPRQVPGSWKYVMTSESSTAGVKTDGTMWAWGHNEYGSVGNNTSGDNNHGISSPTQVGNLDGWEKMGSAQHNLFGLREG